MDLSIKDGSGAGYSAKVDSGYRLHTDAVQRTQSQQAILRGDGFNLSTGAITLTTAGQSAVFYLKNDGDTPLVIKEIGIRLGTSTGGTGSAVISVTANPTAGTIISNALALATSFNRNLGSSKAIVGDAYKGATGYTLTGGVSAGVTSTSSFQDAILFDADIFVLPKGTSVGILVTPQTGNTSQSCVVFATAFYEPAALTQGV
jgi:hypothetical protein